MVTRPGRARVRLRPGLARSLVLVVALGLLAGCTPGTDTEGAGGSDGSGGGAATTAAADPRDDPSALDAVEPPHLGACRVLRPSDVTQPDNATQTVPCGQDHTAQTFTVGTFPARVLERGDAYDSAALGTFILDTCTKRFERFVGGDASRVLRSVVSWAWFRPSKSAWQASARWYRCDVVGGTTDAARYRDLPRSAQGLLSGVPPDDWMACVAAPQVAGSPWVPCTDRHRWRAVTSVQVAKDSRRWPGEALMEVRSRDYCSDSVGAWMNYPVQYAFAYTWFHEAEWDAGQRRTICWARTAS